MSLSQTILQDAIIRVGKEFTFSDFERRMSDYSVVQAYKDGKDKLLPASTIQNLQTAVAQTQKIPVLNKYGATVTTSPSCTITPDEVTSAFKALSWAGKGFSVGITPADIANNYISPEDLVAHQIREGLKAVMENLDTAAYNALEANKATSNASAIYPISGNAMQVAYAKKNDFYKNVPAILKRNDMGLKYLDIANTEAIVMEAFLQNQGTANNTNSQYQFNNIKSYRSNRVVTGGTVDETHFLVAENALGIYNWNQYDAQMGTRIHQSKGWGKYVDPIMGFEWGMYEDHDCDGGKFTKKWNFFSYFCFINAFSSDNSSPILKAEILAEV